MNGWLNYKKFMTSPGNIWLYTLRLFDIWNAYRTNQVSCSSILGDIALVFELFYLGIFISYKIVYARVLPYTLR